jgi:hypothetical protein
MEFQTILQPDAIIRGINKKRVPFRFKGKGIYFLTNEKQKLTVMALGHGPGAQPLL